MKRRQFITLLSTTAMVIAATSISMAAKSSKSSRVDDLWNKAEQLPHGTMCGIDRWADFSPDLGDYENYYSDWQGTPDYSKPRSVWLPLGTYTEQEGKPKVALGQLAQQVQATLTVDDFPKELLPGDLNARAPEYYTAGRTGDFELRVQLCRVETSRAQMAVHVCEPNEEDGAAYSVVLTREDLEEVHMYFVVESMDRGQPAGYVEWGTGDQYVRHEILFMGTSKLRDFINNYMTF